jgi:hypothetical protein
MSGDPRVVGPLSAIAAVLADEATAQGRRPPQTQRQSRAGYGATLLSGCYTMLDVCGPLARGPLDPMFQYAWWGCAVVGVYWLLAGLFGGTSGPPVGGPGLLAEAAGAGWLLWNQVYPAAMPQVAFLLHGVYVAALCAVLAQVLAVMIALRSNDAQSNVQRHIEENAVVWRSARR